MKNYIHLLQITFTLSGIKLFIHIFVYSLYADIILLMISSTP